ncbi:hypothetical protein HY491_02185 [Candidatus Woesearchaeota archaeon]|nr:hypothetical protein [Candidatus Woesearchaeota archaeon]
MEQALAHELVRFQSDFLFFQKEVGKLRKQYLNKFIAVQDSRIIGSASSIEELKQELDKKNVDISQVVVEFVSEEENFMVL